MHIRIRQAVLLLLPAAILLQAQAPVVSIEDQGIADHANCSFFGEKRDKIVAGGKYALSSNNASFMTGEVASRLAPVEYFVPGGSRTYSQQQLDQRGTIDRNLFGEMQKAGVTPADRTNDFEYIRRVTLDLTGRIPDPLRVQSFLADTRTNKRELLVDELLAKPEWTDKWAMYFGDLLKIVSRNAQIPRYPEGVSAFQKWIRDSLTSNKPYNQMATELITATGTDSYTQGELNFIVGGVVTGGPQQDIWDSQTVLISSSFLGISHLNCLLCHNGRGHLDSLSVWGRNATRQQAWGMSSFMAKTLASRTSVDPANNNQPYYWAVNEDPRFRTDYPLNTTTGNRPARQPIGTLSTIAPLFMFSGRGAKPGENYRVAFAREVTTDFQFSRAAVNYMWSQFFGKGIVEPVDGFDPARLDPNNPPPDGWAIQPTNPQLLTELAQDFINSKYNLKGLMKQIVTSDAYQLSSRYNGTWDASWEKLFARKFVRRLWGEEIHDAVVQSSGLLPVYNLQRVYPNSSATESWAMRSPETVATPDNNGAVSRFLDSFLRGNRDDEDRQPDGSISQSLSLMNDAFVMTRIRGTGNGNLLLVKNLSLADDALINTLFLNVLSRYPTAAEMTASQAQLKSGTRTQAAEDMLWSLYNKVDFIFNY